MARDNEKILEVITSANASLRDALTQAILAEAPPRILMGFLEGLRSLECATSEMGERLYVPDQAIHAAVHEAIAPTVKRLEDLSERIEAKFPEQTRITTFGADS